MLLDYVEKIAKEKGKTAITCRVAIDLESNKFWSACGYNIQATTINLDFGWYEHTNRN